MRLHIAPALAFLALVTGASAQEGRVSLVCALGSAERDRIRIDGTYTGTPEEGRGSVVMTGFGDDGEITGDLTVDRRRYTIEKVLATGVKRRLVINREFGNATYYDDGDHVASTLQCATAPPKL